QQFDIAEGESGTRDHADRSDHKNQRAPRPDNLHTGNVPKHALHSFLTESISLFNPLDERPWDLVANDHDAQDPFLPKERSSSGAGRLRGSVASPRPLRLRPVRSS